MDQPRMIYTVPKGANLTPFGLTMGGFIVCLIIMAIMFLSLLFSPQSVTHHHVSDFRSAP
jgi:hypothetical protein